MIPSMAGTPLIEYVCNLRDVVAPEPDHTKAGGTKVPVYDLETGRFLTTRMVLAWTQVRPAG